MEVMVHPDLKDQEIRVPKSAVPVLEKSGWKVKQTSKSAESKEK